MKNSMGVAASEIDSLSMDTILQATLGDKNAIRDVVKAFKFYISAQSRIHSGTQHEYVDEELAQALRRTLVETIPKFRFKAGA